SSTSTKARRRMPRSLHSRAPLGNALLASAWAWLALGIGVEHPGGPGLLEPDLVQADGGERALALGQGPVELAPGPARVLEGAQEAPGRSVRARHQVVHARPGDQVVRPFEL